MKKDSEALKENPQNQEALFSLLINQYMYSWGVRGDNTPKAAEYLNYLDARTLWPDAKGITLEQVYTDVLEGKPSGFVEPTNFNMDDIPVSK